MNLLSKKVNKKNWMILLTVSFLSALLFSSPAHAKRDQYVKDSEFIDTGFFYDYSGLMEDESGLLEGKVKWEQAKEGIKLSQYKKTIIFDFTNTSGMAQGVSLRKSIPDKFAETLKTLDLLFTDIKRSSVKIEPKDYTKIKSLPADVVIMGNIKKVEKGDMAKREVKANLLGIAVGDMPKVSVELKLVDTKTGEEVVRIVDSVSGTTTDEAAEGIIKRITNYLLKKM